MTMLDAVPKGRFSTRGADKAHDTRDFMKGCRARSMVPQAGGAMKDA
ncbi:MAG: hypothetical protein KIT73_02890 [Burkholderiales bacterium]|nr:hypothetical protein [Burkholderiales bacterium]